MTAPWASHEVVGSSETFQTLHSGLTVALIETTRQDFRTCRSTEALAEVIARNEEQFDFLPVIESEPNGQEEIVGLFNASRFFKRSLPTGTIQEHHCRLSEQFLIGADASILDFIVTADERQCRLVVSGKTVTGLVSLSDLQRLPVRAALFALITGFEMTMAEAIRAHFPSDEDWKTYLDDEARRKLTRMVARAHSNDSFVDEILLTNFSDKRDVVVRSINVGEDKCDLYSKISDIKELRNHIAHAKNYAATRQTARDVCAKVRNILRLRNKIADTYSSKSGVVLRSAKVSA